MFKAWAKKNVILVEVDSPKKTQLPADLMRIVGGENAARIYNLEK